MLPTTNKYHKLNAYTTNKYHKLNAYTTNKYHKLNAYTTNTIHVLLPRVELLWWVGTNTSTDCL